MIKQKQTEAKFKINGLYLLANDYYKRAVDTEEVEKQDVTELYYREKEKIIENNEKWSCQINGKVRGGKSTLAIADGMDTFETMKKLKKCDKKKKFTIKNIARDDQEYSKIMRDSETKNTVLVIDEYNALESTGENVTTERALKNVFADVQAIRMVHTISCAPRQMTDESAEITLEVMGIDKPTRRTLCKLYYNYFTGGQSMPILLGHVKLSVGKLIDKWESEVKEVFLKDEKTKEDEKFIEKAMREDLYCEYMVKKIQKIDMLTKEGIYRPRELEYSGVIKKVAERIKPLVSVMEVSKDIVRGYVETELNEQRIPHSILGLMEATNRANGIVDLFKAYEKIRRKEIKSDMIIRSGIQGEELEKEKKNNQIIVEGRKIAEEAIEIRLKELEKYEEIRKKYERFEEK